MRYLLTILAALLIPSLSNAGGGKYRWAPRIVKPKNAKANSKTVQNVRPQTAPLSSTTRLKPSTAQKNAHATPKTIPMSSASLTRPTPPPSISGPQKAVSNKQVSKTSAGIESAKRAVPAQTGRQRDAALGNLRAAQQNAQTAATQHRKATGMAAQHAKKTTQQAKNNAASRQQKVQLEKKRRDAKLQTQKRQTSERLMAERKGQRKQRQESVIKKQQTPSEKVPAKSNSSNGITVSKSDPGLVAGKPDATWGGNPLFHGRAEQGPYGMLKEVGTPKPGGKYSQKQKQLIRDTNMMRNNDVLRSDMDGTRMVREQKSVRGVTPPKNGAQLDHSNPRSKGGSNSMQNARLITREQNRAKSNK